jgi:hypothetical protein
LWRTGELQVEGDDGAELAEQEEARGGSALVAEGAQAALEGLEEELREVDEPGDDEDLRRRGSRLLG